MDMDFVGAFELEYGRMVDFSRIIGCFDSSVTNIKVHGGNNLGKWYVNVLYNH